MAWFLDTNIIVFCLRGKSPAAMRRLHAVPALMQQIADRVREEGGDPARYRQLRTLWTGGDAVPASLLVDLRQLDGFDRDGRARQQDRGRGHYDGGNRVGAVRRWSAAATRGGTT